MAILQMSKLILRSAMKVTMAVRSRAGTLHSALTQHALHSVELPRPVRQFLLFTVQKIFLFYTYLVSLESSFRRRDLFVTPYPTATSSRGGEDTDRVTKK